MEKSEWIQERLKQSKIGRVQPPRKNSKHSWDLQIPQGFCKGFLTTYTIDWKKGLGMGKGTGRFLQKFNSKNVRRTGIMDHQRCRKIENGSGWIRIRDGGCVNARTTRGMATSYPYV